MENIINNKEPMQYSAAELLAELLKVVLAGKRLSKEPERSDTAANVKAKKPEEAGNGGKFSLGNILGKPKIK